MSKIYRVLPGLIPGKRYLARVRSINKLGLKSGWSEVLDLKVPADSSTPAAPENLVADFLTKTLFLSWDNTGLNSDGTDLADFSHYKVTLTANSQSTEYTTFSPSFTYSYEQNVKDFGTAQPVISVAVQVVDVTDNASTAATVEATNPDPVKPQDITGFSAITSMVINMSADPADQDIATYHLSRSTQSGSGFSTIYTGPNSTYIDEAPNQSETYYYKYFVTDAFGQSSPSSNETSITSGSLDTADVDPPDAVQDFQVVTNAIDAATHRPYLYVEWTPNNTDADLSHYEIRVVRDSDSFVRSIIAGPGASSHTISDLEESTAYSLVMYAFDNVGNRSAPSSTVNVTTVADDSAPSTPLNPMAVGGMKSINVSWDTVSHPRLSHYEAYASTTSGFTPDPNTNLVFSGNASRFVKDAGFNETWYFVVRAVNSNGQASSYTAEFSGTSEAEFEVDLDTTPPTDVTNVGATASTYYHGSSERGKVVLSWDASTDDSGTISSYIIRIREDGGIWEELIVGGESLSHTITNLEPGSTYEFQLKASDPSGNRSSAWSSVVQRTISTDSGDLPDTVTGLTATSTTRGIIFSWNEITDAKHNDFLLETSTSVSFTSNVRSRYVSGTDFTLAASSGTTHYARLRARDIYGNLSSTYSSVVGATVAELETEDIAEDAVTSEKILDGSIALEKFGVDLRPVQVLDTLPSLPDASYPPGSVVSLRSDGKLYRNESDAWTAGVPTNDLDGQITGTQITDDAITTEKIAANAITADQIQANAITSEKIIADAITASKIFAGSVGTDQLAANSILAAHIQAGVIDTTHISTIDLASDTIFTGSLNASRITVGAASTFDEDYDPTTKETPEGAQRRADRARADAESISSAMSSLMPLVSLGGGSIQIAAYEDGVSILKNGIEVVSDMAVGDRTTLGMAIDDIIETTGDAGCMVLGNTIGPVPISFARKRFAYRNPTVGTATAHFWSESKAHLELRIDDKDKAVPDYTLDLEPGVRGSFSVPVSTGGEKHFVTSDAPVVGTVNTDGKLFILWPNTKEAFSRQITGPLEWGAGIQSTLTTGTGTSYRYVYSDDDFAVITHGDGSGGNAEHSVPLSMLGDTYGINHTITGYTVATVESCIVSVYYWDSVNSKWELYDSHDFTGASRETPMHAQIGSESGGGSDLVAGANVWKLTSNNGGRFYARTNSGSDEYSVWGHRSDMRHLITPSGKIRQYSTDTATAIDEAIRGDFTGSITGTKITTSGIETNAITTDLLESNIAIINGLRVQSLFEMNAAGAIESSNFAAGTAGFRLDIDSFEIYGDGLGGGTSLIIGGASGLNMNSDAGELWFSGANFNDANWRVANTGSTRIGGEGKLYIDGPTGDMWSGNASPSSAPWIITGDGEATFKNVVITGEAMSAGAKIIDTSAFDVTKEGNVTASNIQATGGTIGGVTINETTLSGGTIEGSTFKIQNSGQVLFEGTGSIEWDPAATGGIYLGDAGTIETTNFDGTSGFKLAKDGLVINEGTIKAAALQIGISGVNLLRNSSFEDFDGSDAPLEWTLNANTTSAISTDRLFQERSINLGRSSTGNIILSQTINLPTPVTAGEKIFVSYYAKKEGGPNTPAHFVIKDGATQNTLFTGTGITINSASWQRVTEGWLVDATYSSLILEIRIDNVPTNGNYLIDGAQLQVSDFVTPYVPAPLDIPENYIQSSHISDLSADRISSGTINAAVITVDAAGVIQSIDYGTSGYQLTSSGAVFENGAVTLVGGGDGGVGYIKMDGSSLRLVAGDGTDNSANTKFMADHSGVYIGGNDSTADVYFDAALEKTTFNGAGGQFTIDTSPAASTDPADPTGPDNSKILTLKDGSDVTKFYLDTDGRAYFSGGIVDDTLVQYGVIVGSSFLLGGDDPLNAIDDAISSDDFISGTSGFALFGNTGAAEFNDVTIRGTISGATFVDGIIDISESSGEIEQNFDTTNGLTYYDGDDWWREADVNAPTGGYKITTDTTGTNGYPASLALVDGFTHTDGLIQIYFQADTSNSSGAALLARVRSTPLSTSWEYVDSSTGAGTGVEVVAVDGVINVDLIYNGLRSRRHSRIGSMLANWQIQGWQILEIKMTGKLISVRVSDGNVAQGSAGGSWSTWKDVYDLSIPDSGDLYVGIDRDGDNDFQGFMQYDMFLYSQVASGLYASQDGGLFLGGSPGSERSSFTPSGLASITFADGEETAPSISFDANSGLGLYASNSASITVSVGGEGQIVFDGGGIRPTADESGIISLGTATYQWDRVYAKRYFVRDGAQDEPSISFTTDPNTGFYRNASDNIAVTLGGTAMLIFDSSPATLRPTAAFDLAVDLGDSSQRYRDLYVERVQVENGTLAAPALTFRGDNNTGFYSIPQGNVGFAANGTDTVQLGTTGLRVELGGQTAPSYSFIGDDNTGFYSPGNGIVAMTSNGNQRYLFESHLYPSDDGVRDLGKTTNQWDDVHSVNGITSTSDVTRKRDTIPLDKTLGIEFINALQPISFKFVNGERPHTGFSAQQVKETMDLLNIEDWAGYVDPSVNGEEAALALRYSEFIAPIVKAIQVQQKKIEELEAYLEALPVKPNLKSDL